MHGSPERPHYSPASVGVLIDPAFLRRAMLDANGYPQGIAVSSATLLSRWRSVVGTVAVALARR